jgi:glucose-1-phosphate adenylyltransferase
MGAVIAYHINSGADVTMLCCDQWPDSVMEKNCVEVRVNAEGRAVEMFMNKAVDGCVLSMNVFVFAKEMLIKLIEDAITNMSRYLERDILASKIDQLNIRVYMHPGFVRRIYSTKSYYDANMSLLNYDNLSKLFTPERPIYTKVRDDAPVRYGLKAKVHNSLLADGCIIEGNVENCVLFRGVLIEEGVTVRNSILMQNTVVQKGARMNYVITDKDVRISSDRTLEGDANYPVYIKKASVI